MLVVDTSSVLAALLTQEPMGELGDRLARDGDLHAPHLIDVEFAHALRRLNLSGTLSDDRAADARSDFRDLALVRYPHAPLADRVWDLRHNLSAYDAMFVVLAESLDVPLVTCDTRLLSAPGHAARVELYGGGHR